MGHRSRGGIGEHRAIEMIDHGVASTPYLRFGERVRMVAFGEDPELPLSCVLDQAVRANVPGASVD